MHLVYDSRNKGWQSNIYKKWSQCIKQYIWLTKDQVEQYLLLQSSFNWVKHTIELDTPIKINNNKIKLITLTFPHTTTQTYEMEWYSSTNTDFIDWDTFDDLFIKNTNKENAESILFIHSLITDYIAKIRSFDMSSNDFPSQIHEINIKIVNYDEYKEELKVCITDIACSIHEFLKNNKRLIKNIMS